MAQHNGVSERCNRTLLDTVRSMIDRADLPKTFWGYALITTIYLLNRVPTKAISTTPYKVRTSKKPLISYLKIWDVLLM